MFSPCPDKLLALISLSFSVYVYVYRMAEIDLPYFSTEITTTSSPFALSLAKHLRSIGAKMYGAFWCSHCLEQKQVNLASFYFLKRNKVVMQDLVIKGC